MTSPMTETWLATRMPKRPRTCRARLPAATRAAVSRALARSRMSRMSSCPYLTAPARSACPGRGRVTSARRTPLAPSGMSGSTYIVCCQLTQSRFRINSAIGAPVVRPWRTPARISTRSLSMAIRPSASVTPLASPKLVVECRDIELKARRHPVNGDDQCLAVRLTRREKSQHAGSFYLSCVDRRSHPPAGAREATVRAGPGDTLPALCGHRR